MHYCIHHRTRYEYGRPVFLEPHRLRLVPRGDACQRLLSFAAVVDPTPAGQTLVTDALGNTSQFSLPKINACLRLYLPLIMK